MRMRGISPLRNGIAYVECALVPLMSCAVSIGEDLSARRARPRARRAREADERLRHRGSGATDVAAIAVSAAATALLAASLAFPGAIA